MVKRILRILTHFRVILIVIFVVGVLLDIFVNSNSDMNLLLLCVLWVLVVKLFKFNSAITFKVTLIFLALLFFLFIVASDQKPIERVATWIFFFLALGIVQQFREVTS